MLSLSTRAVNHFGKYVPCREGRALAQKHDPARLVRVNTSAEAEAISNRFRENNEEGYIFGDNYMLSQHPLSAPTK